MKKVAALSMRRDGNTICLSLAIAIQVLERIPKQRRPRVYADMRSMLRLLTEQRNEVLYRDSAATLIEQAFERDEATATAERAARSAPSPH